MSFLLSAGLFGGDIPDSVVDHFEAVLYEDEGNTLSDYYSGELSYFARQQTTVYEGEYAVDADTPDNAGYAITSVEGSGLPRYPTRGDRLRMAWNPDSESAPALGTCVVSEISSGSLINTSCYHLTAILSNDEIRLQKTDGAGRTTLDSTSVSYSAGGWFDLEIYPQSDGTIDGAIYDSVSDDPNASPLASVSATDSDYDASGVGIEGNSTSTGGSLQAFDYARVVE